MTDYTTYHIGKLFMLPPPSPSRYDAASDDEDPTSHWIGREVKRFITQADKHLPFLLQVAAAPIECIPEMAAFINDAGQEEMEHDEEYAPTAEQIAQEKKEEPLVIMNAQRWDTIFDLVRGMQAPWPQGDLDTDGYHKVRAVQTFNLAWPVCRDLRELKPTGITWVPHILLFIVPRQMPELGDPARRSCDSCESFGAMLKKIIKHSTCRRRLRGDVEYTHGVKATATATERRWKQTFKVGYIQQAFTRACVRESLRHGPENSPFLQRVDAQRANTGIAAPHKKFMAVTPEPMKAMVQLTKELQAADVAAAEKAKAAS